MGPGGGDTSSRTFSTLSSVSSSVSLGAVAALPSAATNVRMAARIGTNGGPSAWMNTLCGLHCLLSGTERAPTLSIILAGLRRDGESRNARAPRGRPRL